MQFSGDREPLRQVPGHRLPHHRRDKGRGIAKSALDGRAGVRVGERHPSREERDTNERPDQARRRYFVPSDCLTARSSMSSSVDARANFELAVMHAACTCFIACAAAALSIANRR